MANIALTEDFQIKVGNRIRDAVGDLLTNDDISRMVEHAIQEIFFKEREEHRGYNNTITHPPYIHELVKDKLEALIKLEVQAWLEVNKEETLKVVKQVIQNGIGDAVMVAFENKLNFQFERFANDIQKVIDPNYQGY